MKKTSIFLALIGFSINLVAGDVESLTDELRDILQNYENNYECLSICGIDLQSFYKKKIKAAEELNQPIFKLVTKGARVENPSIFPPCYQALHFAAETGHLLLIELLLEKKADINKRGNRQWTPLFYAARNGHREICKKLLEFGADATLVDDKGQNCLMIADSNVIEILADQLDINAYSKDGVTAAQLAVDQDDVDSLKKLLQMGARLPLKPANPVVIGRSWVVKKENWPIEMLLIGAGHSMSSLGYGGPYAPLFNKFLQQNFEGPNMTLFEQAIKKSEHEQIVKILADKYQLPYEHVLYTAIRLKNEKILEAVLLNIDQNKNTPINDAISYGTSALYFALYMKNFSAVPLLLKAGANPAYGLRDLRYYVKSITDEEGIKLVNDLKKQAIDFYRPIMQMPKIRVDNIETGLPEPVIEIIMGHMFL
jgi:ankyrin repeat protein